MVKHHAMHLPFLQAVSLACLASPTATEPAQPMTLAGFAGTAPRHVWIIPLGGACPMLAPDAHCALAMIDRAVFRLPSLAMLRTAYGLTETEAMVASDLVRGLSPNEISADRRVSINTVRTHIRRILEKSETTRITDFMNVVLALV